MRLVFLGIALAAASVSAGAQSPFISTCQEDSKIPIGEEDRH